ncbi:ParA family protein (plasmid) [Streptomyces sp. NBC_00377]|uniref:ParA family protein n=1 Tax=unclassified Streptomyces TaxID=2593676 RepID=UPI002E1C490D|nr:MULTISPECIES: ParA family protein [unclassified Streptomyces]
MSKSLMEWQGGRDGRPPIVAASAYKGGDGKSTFARELAWLLDAVLVDFDWDMGCSSRSMGYRHERYATYPLQTAFSKGTTPRPNIGARRADLIPSYPELVDEQPPRDEVSEHLERWARELGRPLVVDTHPGGGELTYGALNAADSVVVPAVLVKESLNALSGMVDELAQYPLIITPNKIDSPPGWARTEFRAIVERYGHRTGPLVHNEKWIGRRRLNVAISSSPVPKKAERFVASMDALAEAVINYE